jgi:hypothetical protein
VGIGGGAAVKGGGNMGSMEVEVADNGPGVDTLRNMSASDGVAMGAGGAGDGAKLGGPGGRTLARIWARFMGVDVGGYAGFAT